MSLFKASATLRGMKRFGGIARALVKHGLGDVVERIASRKEERAAPDEVKGPTLKPGVLSPHRLRLVLEELGPSFIKLGQLLSTRADILPPEYIEELRKLQDQVPPIPFAEIQEVIERELERPINEIFPDYNPEAFAAASVAQVHHATLPGGEKVVVKVIRPAIEEKIREDIAQKRQNPGGSRGRRNETVASPPYRQRHRCRRAVYPPSHDPLHR